MSLTTAAYQEIKRLIIACELPPGRRVTQSQLLEILPQGKAPVRDALARLAAEGLVVSIPRLGYRIAPITLKDVREIFGMRVIVEPAAAELASRHADDAALSQLIMLAREPPEEESMAETLQRGRDFHVGIAKCSGNTRLADAIEKLVEASERLVSLQLMSGLPVKYIHAEHERIAYQLVARDAAGAKALMTEETMETERNILELLTSSSSIASVELTFPFFGRES